MLYPLNWESPYVFRLIIRNTVFWEFAHYLNYPFGTLFGGGPHPRQDSLVGVLLRPHVGRNEPESSF